MRARWLPDGNIEAPVATQVELPCGGTAYGDGLAVLAMGTSEWARWAPHVPGLPPEHVAQQVAVARQQATSGGAR